MGLKRKQRTEKVLSILFLTYFLLFLPLGKAECQVKSFVPTLTNWFGRAEVYSTYELNRNTYAGRGRDVSRFDLYEKVTIGVGGFVYHPRFAIFNLSMGFGLQESYFKSDGTDSWDFGTLTEYEAKILFLPTHPYSLELFSRRRNPYIQQSLSPGINPVRYEHGFNLLYDTRRLKLRLGYTFDSLRVKDIRTNTHTLHFGASHHRQASITRLNYTHIKSRNLTDFDSDSLYANNRLVYKNVTLHSRVSFQRFDQINREHPLTDDLFEWRERLVVEIVEDLTANAHYERRKFERQDGFSALNEHEGYGAGLSHRFYDSIDSSYGYAYSTFDALISSSEIESHSFSTSYRKRIRSSMIRAGYSGRRAHTRRTGPLRIINESHEATPFPPDDTFVLDERGEVEESSISINIIEPGTGIRYELIRGLEYITEVIGNETSITILSVEGISQLIGGDGPFTFLVSYTIPASDTVYDDTRDSYFIRLELFSRRLVPYFSVTKTKQEVLEGELPGNPLDSRARVYGLSILRRTLYLNAEYQDVESRFNPWTILTLRADYQERYSERTSAFIKALYRQTNYQNGERSTVTRPSLREDLFTLTTRVNLIFPRRNITMYLGPNFTYRRSQYKSYGYGFSTGLNWKMGLLNLNTGFTFRHLITKLPQSDSISQNIFFYFRAIRDFK